MCRVMQLRDCMFFLNPRSCGCSVRRALFHYLLGYRISIVYVDNEELNYWAKLLPLWYMHVAKCWIDNLCIIVFNEHS